MRIKPPLFHWIALATVCWTIAVPAFASEPSAEIFLWPNGAPGSEGKLEEVTVRVVDNGERVLSTIHKPSITPYLPESGKATGCAVIVAPGGGHRELWADHEGHFVARRLSEAGIAAFVLKYRLARETNSTYSVDQHALRDMQRAVRYVRSRASDWRINTRSVGVMGFSAGGEVAFLSAQSFDAGNLDADDLIDRETCRPDFQALIYPGRLQRMEPSTNSPAAFLVCGYDDRPDISEGLATIYLKFKQAKRPAELHIYSGVGHGFGFRTNNTRPVNQWVDRFREWLQVCSFLESGK
ncbi:MAG TPA: alpha/beta hydrolase [Verrucomicrobiae bacterium]|nr:alpha/beta hydrolase [Verrucomicrobiae bacterium]